MLLLVSFASPISDAGRQAAAALQLPNLQKLLSRLVRTELDEADVWSLSPPHERVWAAAMGWPQIDGGLPLAAQQAAADGLDVGQRAWGLLSPVHWHVGTDQVSLLDPAQLMLDEAASHAIFDAVAPLFTSEGFELHWATALRWYASHACLADQRCASLDRVIGRNVDRFLGHTGLIRRLQSEVQMLLHTHPINDAREAKGLLPVNSFWLSGCGVLPAAPGAHGPDLPYSPTGAADGTASPASLPASTSLPVLDDRLRSHALAENWPAWVKAWHSLDEGPLLQMLGQIEQGHAKAGADSAPMRLSLCGERASLTLAAQPQSLWQRLRGSFSPAPLWTTLEPL